MEEKKTIKPEIAKNFNKGLAVTVSIPKRVNILCAPERIFCLKQDANFMETSSGLKVSTSLGQEDPDGKKEQQSIKRYFVVAAGSKVKKLKYINEEGKKIKIKKGDEIVLAINPDSTAYYPPVVKDFSTTGPNGEPMVYYSFDQYEVAGVIRHRMDFSDDFTGLRKWIHKVFGI